MQHKGTMPPACVLLLLAAWATAATATLLGSCSPSVTFFPPGAEDRNIPPAWGRSAQMSAGNFDSDKLFTIVMSSVVVVPGSDQLSVPVLQVLPMHDLLVKDKGNISEECMGFEKKQVKGRHLMQDESSSSSSVVDGSSRDEAESWVLSNSSSSHTEGRTGRHLTQALQVPASELSLYYPARFRIQYQINNTEIVDAGEFNSVTPVPKIPLTKLQSLPDGYYCLAIRIILVPWSGLMMPGSIAVPVREMTTTRQVCFYKMDTFSKAQADFETCREPFTVKVHSVQPGPIPLHPGSETPLIQPVLHLRVDLNRTPDYSWPPSDVRTSFEHWMTAKTSGDAAKPFVWKPEQQLVEGWYNLQLEAGLATRFPTLMAVGIAPFSTFDKTSVPETLGLHGMYKYMGQEQYPQGTVRGVQHSVTRFVSLEGPIDMELMTASSSDVEVPFNWQFEGFGHPYCYVDGELFHNHAENTCMPPLNVRVRDRYNHTLKIVLQDVCNLNTTVQAKYGVWGYALTQVPKPPKQRAVVVDGYEAIGATGNPYAFDGALAQFEMGSYSAPGGQMKADPLFTGASSSVAGGVPRFRSNPQGGLLRRASTENAAGLSVKGFSSRSSLQVLLLTVVAVLVQRNAC